MMRRRLLFAAIVLLPLLLVAAVLLLLLFGRQGGMAPLHVPQGDARVVSADAQLIARGEYLARIGNCAGCHTRFQGAPYAGGRAFSTPYGTVYSSNITADAVHGIGAWSLQEFRHAMRHGVSRNGVLSPVFPYENFAHLSDADIDALFAWLARVAPVAEAAPRHQLEFPASLPGAMLGWRLLNYRPAPLPAAAAQPPQWQRGRELVSGIGHCSACHGTRGTLSALPAGLALGGGRIPGWHAPALDARSLAHFRPGDLALYLRGGAPQERAAYGRMADVIAHNLQYLHSEDAAAMETYLRSLPAPPPQRTRLPHIPAVAEQLARGDRLYAEHCTDCHGDDGQGKPGRYPALTDSPALTGPDPVNAIKLILFGAAGPATPLNPQPYTMPPFAHKLDAADTAALVNALRQRWGDQTWGDAPKPVSADDVDNWGGLDAR
jgi:mono/diheme cytochrome c family protein